MKSQGSSRSDWWTRYSSYLKSSEWEAKRQRLYRDRKGRCEDCGKKLRGGYHAHHSTYARVGNEDLGDLVLLCERCHQKRHPGKKIARKKKLRIRKSSLALIAVFVVIAYLLLQALT